MAFQDEDVYALTDKGNAELKAAGTSLSAAELQILVLLDVELPDANGFDVLAKMRLHPLLKSVPVIMLTGSATREAVLKGLQAGADGYVTKPFEPDQVMAAVRAVLGLSAKEGGKTHMWA